MQTFSQKLTVNNWNIRQTAIATGQTAQEVLDKTEKGYRFCYDCRRWHPKVNVTDRRCAVCRDEKKAKPRAKRWSPL